MNSTPRRSSHIVLPAGCPRVEQRLDEAWRFRMDDEPEAWRPEFDDSKWRRIDLPHDFSIEDLPGSASPFDPGAEGGPSTGYAKGGVGWYRKTFTVGKSAAGKRFEIDFDGVYKSATVWINGECLGEHPYGYTAFRFDVSRFIRPGQANVLAVRVDTAGKHTRWYAGSGIYRHVTLTVGGADHLSERGVWVSSSEVSSDNAAVRVQAWAANVDATARDVRISATVLGPAGEQVAIGEKEPHQLAGWYHDVDLMISVPNPKLWSPASPTLYGLVVELSIRGKVRDRVEIPFGIRTVSFDALNGFLLNGEPLKLKGGCVHHDNGPLGSAAFDRAEERRVEVLKAAGYNAVRTSHNPPSTAFLDACDRLGMLVMDEAFDMWETPKNPQDYHLAFKEWWRHDIESMVARDRNHPSVIMWSIGNEIMERFTPEGIETAGRLSDHVRFLDPTRAVTAAICGSWDDPPFLWGKTGQAFAKLDVGGYNYLWAEYEKDHERYPHRVMVGTESFPKEAFENWMSVLDHPYVVGDFVWTALDYIGEAGIGRVTYPREAEQYGAPYPWTVAGCGDIDLCGDRKPQSFYREILWDSRPQVACFVDAVAMGSPGYKITSWGWPDERACWTWPRKLGRTLTVRVYSNCAAVRLTLNGIELGTAKTDRSTRFTASFAVRYEPGELVASGLDERGRESGRCVLRTAGTPRSLKPALDRRELRADGQDLCYVSIDLVDEHGTVCPHVDKLVRLKLTGPGKILAVGSGNPRSAESCRQPKRRTYRGRCWAILKAGTRSGSMVLKATAAGIECAEAIIRVV